MLLAERNKIITTGAIAAGVILLAFFVQSLALSRSNAKLDEARAINKIIIAENNALKKKIQQLYAQVAILKDSLMDAKSSIQGYKLRTGTLENRISEISARVQSAQWRINRLIEELDISRDNTNKLQDELDGAQNKIKAYKEAIVVLKEDLKNTKEERDSTEQIAKRFEREIDNSDRIHSILQEAIPRLESVTLFNAKGKEVASISQKNIFTARASLSINYRVRGLLGELFQIELYDYKNGTLTNVYQGAVNGNEPLQFECSFTPTNDSKNFAFRVYIFVDGKKFPLAKPDVKFLANSKLLTRNK